MEADKWEREADALRIGNGHLADKVKALESELEIRTRQRDWFQKDRMRLLRKLEAMTGRRNELGFRYSQIKHDIKRSDSLRCDSCGKLFPEISTGIPNNIREVLEKVTTCSECLSIALTKAILGETKNEPNV